MSVGPQRYRKKPVEIEAMQLGGAEPDDLNDIDERDLYIASVSGWILSHGFRDFYVYGDERPFGIAIETLEGTMIAAHGDYIIRGIQGEFYPCKPDIFEQTYEEVISHEGSDAK